MGRCLTCYLSPSVRYLLAELASGSRFFILGKIEKSRKSQNPGDRDRDLKIPKKSRVKNPGFLAIGIFKSPGFGIFLSLGIFIPGHRDFSKFWDFYPRDFYTRDSGYFRDFFTFGISRGFFIPGIGIFFVGWDFPTKSQLCLLVTNSERFWLHQIRLCNLQHWIKDFATSYWRRGLNVA